MLSNFVSDKMSFSVRFNAEDGEVEGLCTAPSKLQSTGIIIICYLLSDNINIKHKKMLDRFQG